MLGGEGWTLSATCRQVFTVRYLESGVTTPLIVLALGLLAGVEKTDMFAVMGINGTDL